MLCLMPTSKVVTLVNDVAVIWLPLRHNRQEFSPCWRNMTAGLRFAWNASILWLLVITNHCLSSWPILQISDELITSFLFVDGMYTPLIKQSTPTQILNGYPSGYVVLTRSFLNWMIGVLVSVTLLILRDLSRLRDALATAGPTTLLCSTMPRLLRTWRLFVILCIVQIMRCASLC